MGGIFIRQPTDLTKVSGVWHLSPSDFDNFFWSNGIMPFHIKLGQRYIDDKGNRFLWDGNNGRGEKILWINNEYCDRKEEVDS